MQRGQGSTEYMLMITAAIVMGAIITALTLNLIRIDEASPGNDWNNFESKYAKLNILGATVNGVYTAVKDKPANGIPLACAQSVTISFGLGESIEDYNAKIMVGTKEICKDTHLPAAGVKSAGDQTSNGFNKCWNSPATSADAVVEVRYTDLRSEKDIERKLFYLTSTVGC